MVPVRVLTGSTSAIVIIASIVPSAYPGGARPNRRTARAASAECPPRMRVLAGIALWLCMTGSAWAAFPYAYDGTPPNDLQGKTEWMYAATPEEGNALVNADPRELGGVRGASLVDGDPSVRTAWQTTTGRPDVTIAVLDSGIKWNDLGAMQDLRAKLRLNRGELDPPRHDRAQATEPGVSCASFADAWDADGNGVFNTLDYACDSRV